MGSFSYSSLLRHAVKRDLKKLDVLLLQRWDFENLSEVLEQSDISFIKVSKDYGILQNSL